jgi:hypothetical protein
MKKCFFRSFEGFRTNVFSDFSKLLGGWLPWIQSRSMQFWRFPGGTSRFRALFIAISKGGTKGATTLQIRKI